jgi:hypothetical protein
MALVAGCGGEDGERQSGASPAEGQPLPADALRFDLLTVHDPIAAMDAFRMIIPSGWVAEGGMVWNLLFNNVASLALRVSAPDGSTALEFFPVVPQVWQEEGLGFSEGSVYLGALVRRPTDAVGFLEYLVVPEARGGAAPVVVERAALPEAVEALAAVPQAPGVVITFDAARVRVEYQEPGRAVEEDFYTALSYWQCFPGRICWKPEAPCTRSRRLGGSSNARRASCRR